MCPRGTGRGVEPQGSTTVFVHGQLFYQLVHSHSFNPVLIVDAKNTFLILTSATFSTVSSIETVSRPLESATQKVFWVKTISAVVDTA